MLCCLLSLMPWYEKERSTPFDTTPINGLFFLIGNLLVRQYQEASIKDKKYPVISYPSGLQRELILNPEGQESIAILGSLVLPRHGTRDEAFQMAAEFAAEYDYTLGRRGASELLIFHPHSGHGYAVKYDNRSRQLVNIQRIPSQAMELLDGEGRAILPRLFSTRKLGLEAIAPLRFFAPGTDWSWYPIEYDGRDLFFGLIASGFEVELGYFSVRRMAA